MPTTTVTCSWCHTSVRLTGGHNFCLGCGHEAGVARMFCSCPTCTNYRDARDRNAAACRCGGLCDSGLPCPMRYQ